MTTTLDLVPTSPIPAGPAVTERIRLWGFDETFQSCVNSLLFGEMVRRAQPTLAHYQGDLFHDARWMERHVTGPTTFWWVHREWGTHIGDDFDVMLPAVLSANRCDRMVAYRIDVVCVEREWCADFTALYTTPAAA